jgi:hypothetical protein
MGGGIHESRPYHILKERQLMLNEMPNLRLYHRKKRTTVSHMGPLRSAVVPDSLNLAWPRVLVILLSVLLCGCNRKQSEAHPSIAFEKIPLIGEGGPVTLSPAAGRVKGAHAGEKIVLYAEDVNRIWWVQPQAIQPFITIKSDSTWETSTHLGIEYAALLVDPGYRPPATTNVLPSQGGKVLAVTVVKGVGPLVRAVSEKLEFSGYEWKNPMNVTSVRNGLPNTYDAANASIDTKGRLHLSIVRRDNRWTCSNVVLTHSFGYGTYLFSLEDVSHLEPAAVLTLFTWDDLGADQNHREMDIEISRWGDPGIMNAQFVMQPYYVPENVARFATPPGQVTYSFQWEPAKVSFQALRGGERFSQRSAVATHDFTSGVPSPGTESVSMNFCAFGFSKAPLERTAEVIIDKFQFLP